ncbi:MAG: M48 family metallopeptidase [Spirochaetota bacterium]
MFRSRVVIRDLAIILGVILLSTGVTIGLYHLLIPKGTPEVANDMSLDWEKKLKALLKDQVARESTIIRKAPVTRAMSVIMERLTAYDTNLPARPEIIVIDSPIVNAYTFPGGMIVVTSALIRDAANAEETAAVLAHELGHVAHRDPLALIIRQTGLAVLMAVVSGGNTTIIHDIVRQAVNSHYSKQQENAADEYSCALLIKAGIHPKHSAAFFRKLKSRYSRTAEKILEPLATHPATERRIANAERWAKQFRGSERALPIDWEAVRKSVPSAFDERSSR